MRYGKHHVHSWEEKAKNYFLGRIAFLAQSQDTFGLTLAYPLIYLYSEGERLIYREKESSYSEELHFSQLKLALLDLPIDSYEFDKKIQAREIVEYPTRNIANGLIKFKEEMKKLARYVGKNSDPPRIIIEGFKRVDLYEKIKECAHRSFSHPSTQNQQKLTFAFP